MAKTVVGLLDNPEQARKVVEELLKTAGKKDIGVIAKDDVPAQFKAVAKDMGKGAALGALAGLLLAASTVVVPGLGPLVVAGPAATLVAGATYGGLAGGIIGALISKGVPEDQAHAYAEGVRRGGALVTIHAETDDLAQRAVLQHGDRNAAAAQRRLAKAADRPVLPPGFPLFCRAGRLKLSKGDRHERAEA
jgi:hypothetical protein